MARILIVDDDADASDALVRIFRRRGHAATWAAHGRVAMALLIADTPEFAIFDFRMPDMSGLELLRTMRSYLRLRDVPTLILTAYPEAPELRDAARIGAAGVMGKVNLDMEKVVDFAERFVPPPPPPPREGREE